MYKYLQLYHILYKYLHIYTLNITFIFTICTCDVLHYFMYSFKCPSGNKALLCSGGGADFSINNLFRSSHRYRSCRTLYQELLQDTSETPLPRTSCTLEQTPSLRVRRPCTWRYDTSQNHRGTTGLCRSEATLQSMRAHCHLRPLELGFPLLQVGGLEVGFLHR